MTVKNKKKAGPGAAGLRLRKWLKLVLGAGSLLAPSLALFWWSLIFFPDPLALPPDEPWQWSVKVRDRHGRLLKEFLSPDQTRREYLPLDQFSPHLMSAVLAAEDKRFHRHPGVDPLAVLRAAWLNARRRRIVSGASTITMQLARLNQPSTPAARSWAPKFKEAWLALLIERHHTKNEILTAYFNQAPCGNLAVGFPAAARVYLDKSAALLSPSEAAFLAGLPQSPGALNPYKDPRPALKRRAWIIRRMVELGRLEAEAGARALEEPLALTHFRSPFLAPHFVNHIRRHWPSPPPPTIVTTLDMELQAQVEKLTAQAVSRYGHLGLSQAAAVVMEVESRRILAWVGSVDFFDVNEGQNDGVLALRQPGSSLKPFTYATAFEQGLTPADLIDDEATVFSQAEGAFNPRNYSGRFHGQVPARVALASSLNIPALKVIEQAGVNRVLKKLRAAGLNSLTEEADYYGLALTLGSGEASLLQIANAFAVFADRGRFRPIRVFTDGGGEEIRPRKVFSPQASYLITDILSDDAARATGFGRYRVLNAAYPVAVKTGTSKNFRDNWCFGYTDRIVVGVWAGNFNATPMGRVSGVTGAGQLWREVMDIVEKSYPAQPIQAPAGLSALDICPATGLLAGPACPNKVRELFINSLPQPARCPYNHQNDEAPAAVRVVGRPDRLRILFPGHQSRYFFDPARRAEFQKVRFLAQAGPQAEEVIWLINGRETHRQKVAPGGRAEYFQPLAPLRGRLRIGIKELQNNLALNEDEILITVTAGAESPSPLLQ